MARNSSIPLSFPAFRGATRQLVLANVAAYFGMLLLRAAAKETALKAEGLLVFVPGAFLHGDLWQPLTYSFIHGDVLGAALEMVSLWFLAGFLEQFHNSTWVLGLYASAVLGTAAAAVAIYAISGAFGFTAGEIPLYGCFGGIFGMLAVIGVLYGGMEFLLLFTIGIKARHLAILYGLISIAMLFGAQRMYAFAQLGGAAAGLLWIRAAPRRGVSFVLSEQAYGLRNRYYRWKRRRAARKFEVYMKSQGRTVRFDGQGRQLDEDSDDKKRWN